MRGSSSRRASDIAGDITPGYSRLDEDEVARFAARFPATRVIYIARDPIERLWSHLMMTARRNKSLERITLERTVKFARRPMVRLRCTNTEVVRRWREQVGADRFGLFVFDDIRDDPVAARAAILGFLGADPALPSGRLAPDFNRKSRERKLPLGRRPGRAGRGIRRRTPEIGGDLGGAAPLAGALRPRCRMSGGASRSEGRARDEAIVPHRRRRHDAPSQSMTGIMPPSTTRITYSRLAAGSLVARPAIEGAAMQRLGDGCRRSCGRRAATRRRRRSPSAAGDGAHRSGR